MYSITTISIYTYLFDENIKIIKEAGNFSKLQGFNLHYDHYTQFLLFALSHLNVCECVNTIRIELSFKGKCNFSM